jgi:hypothetical protein
MVDSNPFTIAECLVSIWVYEKGQSGQRYFLLHFNKAAPTEANLCKLEKETFLIGFVLDVK